jgi:hypothetical protein
MRRALSAAIAVLAALASGAAAAHGPVARKSEGQPLAARLFYSDSSNGQVVAIDLPSGEVAARLTTPPQILSLGLGPDHRYVFAMRGRDTDRDTITVIDSGLDAGGLAQFPTIVRTFTGAAPGGVRDGLLASVGGRTAIFQELRGELEILESGDFGSLDGVQTRRIRLAAPDHYHYLEAGRYLYVGHLAKGFVQIIDARSGREKARIGGCPVLHGMASDPESGRLFFACRRDVLVIGTRGKELNREVARIDYPGAQRIAAFRRGAGRVLWGSTEGAVPALQRLDAAVEPYAFRSIPVDDSIRISTSDDGRHLFVYSRNGTLEIRDGASGDVRHRVQVSRAFEADYHEHVDKALLPDIVSSGRLAWVTIPTDGAVVEVDVEQGRALRRLEVGGQPTRLLLVEPQAISARN